MRRTNRRRDEQVALFCRQLRREAAAYAASQQRTLRSLDPALRELTGMIRSRYPEATFTVSWGPDNGDAAHLYATVDRINTDLRIPLHTPERNAEVCAHASPSRRMDEHLHPLTRHPGQPEQQRRTMLQARGLRVAA